MEAGGNPGASVLAVPPAPAAPETTRASTRWPGLAAAALAPLAVLLWLLDAAGRGLPPWLDRLVVLAALAAGAAALAVWLARAVRWASRTADRVGELPEDRRAGSSTRWKADLATVLVPAGLLVLALVVRFAGLDWEVGSGYYRDEGIYRATAERINGGRLLVHSFIYGHFLHYAGAFALWLRGLFPGLAAGLARLLYGIQEESQVEWLALRSVAALCGALTVLPVHGIARRVVGRAGGTDGKPAGPGAASDVGDAGDAGNPGNPSDTGPDPGIRAGALAGLLIVASPLFNEVSHLLISDVPAAFFATLCLYFSARLLDGERLRHYLLAGAAAGLAAGSKYPAGVAAVGIAALWAWWRVRERRWSWSLAWAALAAVAAMLAVMPALLVYPRAAFAGEGRDVLFGVRQYGEGGWIGVMPESNVAWYARQVAESFGPPALLLGVLGVALLARRERLRLALVLPFPLAYLLLLGAMHMVVKRNLQPVLPALAAVLGAGLVGWAHLAGRLGRRLAPAFWVVALVSLALPVWATLAQSLSMARVSTREAAVEWIRANVPRGATFVKETYTPNLDRSEYASVQRRFAVRLPLPQILDPANDYLLLAETAYGRFLDEENQTKPHHRLFAASYRRMLALPLVKDFRGGATRRGPHLSLFRLDPPRVEYRTGARFAAADAAFLSDPALAPARPDGPLRFPLKGQLGQFAMFKGYFAPGTYRASLDPAPAAPGGRLEVRTREGHDLGSAPWASGSAEFSVPAPAKLFLYIYLPPGSRLRGIAVEAVERVRAGGAAAPPVAGRGAAMAPGAAATAGSMTPAALAAGAQALPASGLQAPAVRVASGDARP